MNVLIIGKNSFIGNYFKSNSTNFNISEVSLRETKPAKINFSEVDTVLHLAAIVHQSKAISQQQYYEVNSELAFNVALQAKRNHVGHFIFMSTVKVYGEYNTAESAWKETSNCNPQDAYGRSKLEAEIRIMKLSDESFKVSVIRIPVVYGHGVKGNIQKMARFVKSHHIIPFKGINNVRSMIFIGNLNRFIHAIINAEKSGIYLANDPESLSTSKFISLLIDSQLSKKLFIPFPKIVKLIIKKIKPGFYFRFFGDMVLDNTQTIKNLNINFKYDPKIGFFEVMNSLSSD